MNKLSEKIYIHTHIILYEDNYKALQQIVE